jgi:hypothetical protein
LDTRLQNLKSWFSEYVRRFDSPDPDVQKNMDLKALHTHRVCTNILDIGRSLDLSSPDLMVSEICALLHDIGRFEQYRRYRTFADRKSEDHAALGVKIIRENRILGGLDPDLTSMILHVVACHNKLTVPAGGKAQFLMILKMLRDADKLDIWRVVTEYYRDSSNNRNQTVELDLPDIDDISDPICEALMHGEPVKMADLKTLNDFKLLQMGWVYDVNFQRTFQILLEKGYMEAIHDALPGKSGRVEKIYGMVRTYLEQRCK